MNKHEQLPISRGPGPVRRALGVLLSSSAMACSWFGAGQSTEVEDPTTVGELRSAASKAEHLRALDAMRGKYAFLMSQAMSQDYRETPVPLHYTPNGFVTSGETMSVKNTREDYVQGNYKNEKFLQITREYQLDGTPWYVWTRWQGDRGACAAEYQAMLCIDSINGRDVPFDERCTNLERHEFLNKEERPRFDQDDLCEFSPFTFPNSQFPAVTQKNWNDMKPY